MVQNGHPRSSGQDFRPIDSIYQHFGCTSNDKNWNWSPAKSDRWAINYGSFYATHQLLPGLLEFCILPLDGLGKLGSSYGPFSAWSVFVDQFRARSRFWISKKFCKKFQNEKRTHFWQIQSLELEKLELRKTN